MTSEQEKREARERVEFRSALENRLIRDFMWRFISKGHVFARVGPQSVETTNYLNGKADLAKEMIDEISEISPNSWVLMQEENRGEIDE